MVAKIALKAATYAIDKPYDYVVPAELTVTLRPGMRVIVPFGAGNRRTEGIVLALEAQGPAGVSLKPVLTVLDDSPVLDGEAIKLALWMRERWFCTVYDAARAMLPAGLYYALRDQWKVAEGVDREAAFEAAGKSDHARQVVELLFANGGCADVTAIREAFGTKDPNPALKLLRDKGIITLETSAARGVGDKTEQVATLAMPAQEALDQAAARRRTAPLQYAVVEVLCSIGEASTKELCYFTGASSSTLRALAKSGVITLEKREVYRRVQVEGVEQLAEPVLNGEQQAAFDGLNALAAGNKPAAALLYGVTGSGKTQVYLKLIYETLRRGRTALVLVPEISLTPQLMRLFSSHFGEQIAVLHSSLRAGERYDEWKRIKAGEARVVIGTRSAVFAPLKDLGLIVLDEEQEGTYQSENVPKYHARDVAKFRCVQHKALLLLASATPSIETMYQARQGAYQLFTLKQRYNQRPLPPVEIVDMKGELRSGNGTDLSGVLTRALAGTAERGEQAILLLNRRGASRMVSCGECGEVPTCPRCSVHLTYHSANGRLMCHYCGHSQPLPPACPSCGGTLNFIGAGTQKVEEELTEALPGREVLRMDADSISATHSHEKLFARFEGENIPVLLGTQMVAKGLDFPNVTLVGVINADQSLYVDDYRAGERTFSLLTQVVGRAGRGARGGRAIIQTYTPDNDVIRCAARQDYDGFYQQEIALRLLRGCPPFRDLFVLTASGKLEAAVLRTCMRLRRTLEGWLRLPAYEGLEVQLLGPAPASIAKINERYRYRLTMACANTKPVRDMIAALLRAAQTDKENKGVSVTADVNPLD